MIFHDLSIFFDIFLHHFAPCHGRKTTILRRQAAAGAHRNLWEPGASHRALRHLLQSHHGPIHDTTRHGVSHGVSHRVWKNGVLICLNGVLWWLLMVYDVWYCVIYDDDDAQYAFRHPPLIYSLTIELHWVVVRQGVDLSWPFSISGRNVQWTSMNSWKLQSPIVSKHGAKVSSWFSMNVCNML